MKKFLVSILAVMYLSSSVGATVHFHFCMDKLVEWGLGSKKTKERSCSYCGMIKTVNDKHCINEAKGCCKDEQKHIRIEKDQKVVVQSFSLAKPDIAKDSYTQIEIFSKRAMPVFWAYSFAHAPPFFGQYVPVFVRNCVFRI